MVYSFYSKSYCSLEPFKWSLPPFREGVLPWGNYYLLHFFVICLSPTKRQQKKSHSDPFRFSPDLDLNCVYEYAAEQKARSTYDNILRLVRDYPDVYEPIKFLRAREIVHFQRFGEAKRTDLSRLLHVLQLTLTLVPLFLHFFS